MTIQLTYDPRFIGLNAIRLLAFSGVVSWSIVAIETWMLIR